MIYMIIGMTWIRDIDQDGTVYWSTKIGPTHIHIARIPDSHSVRVWVSLYPEMGWELVHKAKTLPAAKTWAERTYS